MSDQVNPYAVTSTGEPQLHPIHFCGLATRDDLMMSLLDSPPKKGWARLQYPLMVMAVIPMAWLMAADLNPGGQSLPAIIWILVGAFALPGWFRFIRFLQPGRRKQIARINTSAARQTPNRGWIDEEFLVFCDDHSVFRANWSFIGGPLVFPTHLLLPLTTDSSRRIVLPWRFFYSVEDILALCQHIKTSYLLVDDPPKEAKLAKLVAEHESYPPIDVDSPRRWSADDWPFPAPAEGQFDCTLNLGAQLSTRKFAFYSAIGIVVLLFWAFLPLWIAGIGWFLHEFWATGSFDFVVDRLWSSLLVIIPLACAMLFSIYVVGTATLKSRHVQTQPFQIRMRSSGIHLGHQSFDSWFRWSAVEDLIAEEDDAGWVAYENGEDIRFPKVTFPSDEAFEDFKTNAKVMYDAWRAM